MNLSVKLFVLALLGVTAACDNRDKIDYSGPIAEWPSYGGNEQGLRFSPLTQIAPANVDQLELVWSYRMGSLPADYGKPGKSVGILPRAEVTPIMAEGKLFLCTPLNKVVALDPESGKELWTYDTRPQLEGRLVRACRGVTYYRNPDLDGEEVCAATIFTGTVDARLVALDAATGKPCSGFGNAGEIDLTKGLGEIVSQEYGVTSPPAVAAGVVITGSMVLDNRRRDAPPGVIRAFDVRTGEMKWAWNPLPPGSTDPESPKEGESLYVRGTPNAWSVFSVDRERGMVFVPTGNASPDFFGGEREGLDFYSSSVVALDIRTGKPVWHFQTVHHDLWDYDVPAQPVLFDFPSPDGVVPAVAVATKMGHIFILDRETGKPLVPVEERPVPQTGEVPEEVLSPTQPFPANSVYALHPHKLTADEAWGFTFWDRGKCRDAIKALHNEGIFTPPSRRGSILFPATTGGSNWGGITIDQRHNILIANTTRLATGVRLVPGKPDEDRKMAIREKSVYMPMSGTPYAVEQIYPSLLSPLGVPCNPPPWGVLTAIDLAKGETLWEIPFGTIRDLAPLPLRLNLGVPNQGGGIVTASGLLFIGAAADGYFRAYDTRAGQELWQYRLPASAHATPMTYRLPGGKQHVVVAAGGHPWINNKRLSDHIMAFALPDKG